LGLSRIFWDTNLFIYLLEGSDERTDKVRNLRTRMLTRNDELFTSALTLGEVLVKPQAAQNAHLAAKYESLISGGATVVPFDVDAARLYADIRLERSIKAPDAIQLACASLVHADLFITNDDRLSQRSVPGIQFIMSLDRAFL
jgi:predicted nucleic acid-binding protein